jgi:hypothetical protein
LLEFLRQDHTSSAPLNETLDRLNGLGKKLEPAAAMAVRK